MKDQSLPEFVKYESIIAPVEFELPFDRLQAPALVFEKVDGGNCQIRRPAEWQLLAGSRSNFLTGNVAHKRFWFQNLLKWMRTNSSLYSLPENFIMFGEWMGHHTIDYGVENDQFVFLDLLDLRTKKFRPYDEAVGFLQEQGITGFAALPALYEGVVNTKVLEKLVQEPSSFYPGPREGLVIKDYSSTPQVSFKVYHPDFVEKRKALDDPHAIEGIDYLTPGRYERALHRLLDGVKEVISKGDIVEEVLADVAKEARCKSYSREFISNRLSSLAEAGRFGSDFSEVLRNLF